MVIVKILLKWLATALLTVVTLFAIGIMYVTLAVDINGYKSDIESLAHQQGLALSINGDLGWQFFPKPGLSIADITVTDRNELSGSANSLIVTTHWTQLLKLNDGIDQLQLSTLQIEGGSMQWSPGNSPRLQFDNIQLSTKNLSLQGNRFPISASATAFGGRKFALDTAIALRFNGRDIQQLNLFDLAFSLDSIKLSGELSASDNGALVQGNLKTNSFDLKQLMASLQPVIPTLTAPNTVVQSALTNVSLETHFSLDTGAVSKFISELSLDGQVLQVDMTIDHPTNSLTTLVSGDVLRAGDYLLAANSDGNSSSIFAPLAIPFALWQGRSQVEVSLGRIEFNDFSVKNFYSNIFGNQRVLSLTSLNADVFNGQINAIAKLDMRSSTPSFNMQPSVKSINLALALAALADYKALKGTLSLDSNIKGSGDSMDSILESITGAGQFDISSPSYTDINVEQTFCNAAALLGSRGQSNKSWPVGTNLDDLSGRFQVSQGKLSINEYSTGTGNLSIMGRGTIALLKRTYNIRANALLDGATSSSNGCSVNTGLQNRQIPFICKGSFDGGSTECKPDERLLKDLLKRTALEALGGKLLKGQNKGSTADENNTDPLKSLLNDYLKRKLKE